jgi:hypothetical protein
MSLRWIAIRMVTDSAWRGPQPCPKCLQSAGRAWRVESRQTDQVVVVLRCGDCGHEWTTERSTPLLADSNDPSAPPDDPA